jgi:hypothetical protein
VCGGADLCANVTCTAQDQCHDAGVCDHANGQCSNPAKANGSTCNDGNACTQTDTCQSGTCTGSNPVVCTAQDQCHDAGTCTPSTGVCTNPAKANGATCNDGQFCNGTDTCSGGACSNHAGSPCGAGTTCNEATDQCDQSCGGCILDPTNSNKGIVCDAPGKKPKSTGCPSIGSHQECATQAEIDADLCQ